MFHYFVQVCMYLISPRFRGNEPKKTGAHSTRARTRGQNYLSPITVYQTRSGRIEPRKWKILGRTRDPSLCEKEALEPRKRKHWSPGRGNTETMKRNNGAFGNGGPRALEKENLKLRKRNVEGKKHLGLRKKETIDLLTKKPWSH